MADRIQLKTEGMKGHDHEVEIAPLTLVSAPNAQGKSTLADAIRFAALGYSPNLGKRTADTAALMRGNQMAVTVTLPDDRVFTRALSRKGKGTSAKTDLPLGSTT